MNQEIFISRNFFLLWIGKLISQIGDKFYAIALAWWILQKTSSPKMMGFFLLTSVLPGLVFGLFAGALTDHLNRKIIIVATDVIRGLFVIIIVFLSLLDLLEVWHVFVIGAALSLTTAFFDPAIQAIIPQIVAKERLNEANAMNQIVNGICTVAGPVFGAMTVSFFGLTAVFLFNGISYLISALLGSMISLERKFPTRTEPENLLASIKEGLCFLLKKKEVLRVILIIAVCHFFLGSIMVLLPFLAKMLNGSGVQNLGNLEAMLGIGLLAGSLYIGRKKIEKINEIYLIKLIIFVGLCLLSISFFQFLAVKTVSPYMIILMLIGVSIACAAVYWQSLIQLNTPGHMTGRVFSVSSLAGNASLPVAYGVFGVLLSHSSIMQLMLLSGTCLILICIFLSFNLKTYKTEC